MVLSRGDSRGSRGSRRSSNETPRVESLPKLSINGNISPSTGSPRRFSGRRPSSSSRSSPRYPATPRSSGSAGTVTKRGERPGRRSKGEEGGLNRNGLNRGTEPSTDMFRSSATLWSGDGGGGRDGDDGGGGGGGDLSDGNMVGGCGKSDNHHGRGSDRGNGNVGEGGKPHDYNNAGPTAGDPVLHRGESGGYYEDDFDEFLEEESEGDERDRLRQPQRQREEEERGGHYLKESNGASGLNAIHAASNSCDRKRVEYSGGDDVEPSGADRAVIRDSNADTSRAGVGAVSYTHLTLPTICSV